MYICETMVNRNVSDKASDLESVKSNISNEWFCLWFEHTPNVFTCGL